MNELGTWFRVECVAQKECSVHRQVTGCTAHKPSAWSQENFFMAPCRLGSVLGVCVYGCILFWKTLVTITLHSNQKFFLVPSYLHALHLTFSNLLIVFVNRYFFIKSWWHFWLWKHPNNSNVESVVHSQPSKQSGIETQRSSIIRASKWRKTIF